MSSLRSFVAQRDLLLSAGFWQFVAAGFATVLVDPQSDPEFWQIAVRAWLCFWVLLVAYMLFRSRLTGVERLLWSVGPVVLFVLLALCGIAWP